MTISPLIKHKMKITHDDLVTLGNLLGYSNLDEGLCAGFSGMFVNSVLAQDEVTFYSRLNFIETYNKDFPRLVKEIREVQKKEANTLNEKDIHLLDVLAFFDGIALYHSPRRYRDYFPDRAHINQSDMKDIFYLAKPLCLEKNELEILLDKDYVFNKELLKQFFDDLGSLLEQHVTATPIYLASHDHAVSLSYNSQKLLWNYVDTNDFARHPKGEQYVRVLSTKSLVESIFTSFYATNYVAFNTKVLAINNQLAIDELKAKLTLLDLKYPLGAAQIKWSNDNDLLLLYIACKNGHLDIVKELLKSEYKTDIIKPTNNGETPLLVGCQNGYLEIVKELLKPEYKMDINKAENTGVTSFFNACQNGHLEIVKELLKSEYKTDINKPTNNGVSPFYIACQNGHLEIVKELLKTECKTGINKPTNNGVTSFFIACQNGHLEIVKELLKINHKTDTNKPTKNGVTPFFIACQKGYLDIVKELLKPEYKIDINKPANDEATPFFIACENAYLDIVKELLNLEYKTDINKPDQDGVTPFFIACENGYLEIVKELLKPEYKTDINMSDLDGVTPFFIACENGYLEIVKELLKPEYKTDINKPTNDEATPFFIACENGYLDIVKELLEYKTDINKPTRNGTSPFYMACQNGHLDVVKALLASPFFDLTTLNAVGITGHTPLLVACLSPETQGNHALFELLLKHGANPYHKNDANQTALDIAITNNNQAAIRALKQFDLKLSQGSDSVKGRNSFFTYGAEEQENTLRRKFEEQLPSFKQNL